MTKKVETLNTQLQKVTLLIAMHDYDESDLDAGEWLLNVLLTCADKNNTHGHYGAKELARVTQVLEVVDCEVVVSNGI
jgi:hypothetical protein